MTTERKLKRHYWAGMKASVKHVMNPISEEGASNGFRAAFCLAGPHLQAAFEAFSRHPDGQRMLRDRPNLGDQLAAVAEAKDAPEGSFGAAYRDFLGKDTNAMVDTGALASYARIDSLAEELGWDEEIAWFVERMANTHDVYHVLAGYGPGLAAEGGVIMFTFSHSKMRRGLLAAFLYSLRPNVGWRRWHKYLNEGWKRGVATANAGQLQAAYFEELFPRPLEEVRRELGIPGHTEPEGALNWFNMKRYERFLAGYGELDEDMAKGVAALNREAH
jgi:ubiquinone biosynthesis protein COQ4